MPGRLTLSSAERSETCGAFQVVVWAAPSKRWVLKQQLPVCPLSEMMRSKTRHSWEDGVVYKKIYSYKSYNTFMTLIKPRIRTPGYNDATYSRVHFENTDR